MRNILQYPITQDEKNRLILQDGTIGSIEPYLTMTLATEFSEWVWTHAEEYIRGGTYKMCRYSGLDIDRMYTMEELYGHWLNTSWLKHTE